MQQLPVIGCNGNGKLFRLTAMRFADLERVGEARRLAESGEARRIRQRARVTLKETASALGVSTASLSRWETGLSVPRPDAARRWFQLLDRLRIAEGTVDEAR